MYKGVECQSLEKDDDIISEHSLNCIDNLFFLLENIDLIERCLNAAMVRGFIS